MSCSSTRCTCRSGCTRARIASPMSCRNVLSRIICTASKRSPSKRNSSIQYSALSMKNSRTCVRRKSMDAPQGVVMSLREERLGIGVQEVPVRPEMVVDHVQHDAEAQPVGRIDHRLQVVRGAVITVWRIGQGPVVAPVPRPGEVADRHQLDDGDAQVFQPRQLGTDCRRTRPSAPDAARRSPPRATDGPTSRRSSTGTTPGRRPGCVRARPRPARARPGPAPTVRPAA